jgi:hypothetical protein
MGPDIDKLRMSPGGCAVALAGQAVIDVPGSAPLDLLDLAVRSAMSAGPAAAAEDIRASFDAAAPAAQRHAPTGSAAQDSTLGTEVIAVAVVAGSGASRPEVFQVGLRPHGPCPNLQVDPFGVLVIAPPQVKVAIEAAAWEASEIPRLDDVAGHVAGAIREAWVRAPHLMSYELDAAVVRYGQPITVGPT